MDTKTISDSARLPARSAIERLEARSEVAGDYPVYLDRGWVEELNGARERLLQARARNHVDTEAAAQADVDRLEAEKEDKVLTFQFRALGPAEYEELLGKHRPTAEQIERAKATGAMFPPQWNTETFPLAIVRASLLEPRLDEADMRRLYDGGDAYAEDAESKPRRGLLSVIEFKEMVNVALMASTAAPKLEG